MEIPQHRIDYLLDHWPVARLATLGSEGRPHQIPVVFTRIEGLIWSSIDGKPKRDVTPVRVANIRRNPRVSLLLDHYDADWSRLWWLRVDGSARIVEGEGAPERQEVLSGLGAKYPQYAQTPVAGSAALLIRIEVSAIGSWVAEPESLR